MRISVAIAMLLATFPAAAAGPSKDQCLNAHEQGQVAHKKGDMDAARQHFELCSDAACPDLVKNDCGERLKKLAAEIPSLTVRVLGPGGSDAALTVDGKKATPRADGSLELTPGDHVLRATAADGRSAEEQVTLAAGSHGVTITLELPEPKPVEPAPTPKEEPKPSSGVRPAVLVLGGVAVLGLAGFTAFGLAGRSKQSDLEASCAPNCTRDAVDDMRQKYLFADISLGVAVVAGGAAAYLHFQKPKKEKPAPTVAWISGAPLPHGAAVGVGGRF